MGEDERRKVSVLLTEEALDGWRDVCDEHRVSLTAVVEIIGLQLAAGSRTVRVATVVQRAKALDYERLRKRGRRPGS